MSDMIRFIGKSRIFAALALAGLLSGCGSPKPAEKETSPSGTPAEQIAEKQAASSAAPSESVAKEPAKAEKAEAPAAPAEPVAKAPVPEANPVPQVVETTAKVVDAAVPPVNVNVQVNLPDATARVSTGGEPDGDGAEFASVLPQEKSVIPPPQDSDRGRERFRKGPGMWRLYARLTENERRELRELQRQDPERFRQVIRQKLDALYAEDVARREELRTLVRTYQESTDPQQKAELKRRMTLLVRSDFQRRLSENRLQFEDLRARSVKLERELDKRAANAEAIIAFQVDELLSGKLPLDERAGRPPRADAPPRVMRPGHRPPPPPATQPAASDGKK